MNRRELLRATAASALPLLAAPLSAVAAGTAPEAGGRAARLALSLPVHAVIYDGRYVAAQAFAHSELARGARVFDARCDVVRLWRGPLLQLRGRGPVRVAGLTTYSDLILVCDCAREARLAVLRQQWCSGAADPNAVGNAAPQAALTAWCVGPRAAS